MVLYFWHKCTLIQMTQCNINRIYSFLSFFFHSSFISFFLYFFLYFFLTLFLSFFIYFFLLWFDTVTRGYKSISCSRRSNSGPHIGKRTPLERFPLLWSVECKGLLRTQLRTEHGQKTSSSKHCGITLY